MPVALSFLAHPDDAEILCAGTLIRLAQAGWEVHIATATPGDCGTMTASRWEISAIRTAEAKRAAAIIGATYHCLDERDGLVVYDKPAVQKAVDLFRRVSPALVFTHAQDDYMMDHVEVSKLARAASFLFGAPNISAFPLKEGSKIPHLYYCDPVEGIDSLGRAVVPTTLVDVSDVHAKKLEMLSCHASQREWLRAHHGMDEYLEAVRRHDAARGKLMGKAFAEGFVQHRGHAYPANDLLLELFAS
jgi:LmbE family N-acetylglucosaminyl deacetylase